MQQSKLTHAQLSQVVAEIEELSQRRQKELDTEQVKEILRELRLPPELLEDAMVQLHRREALAVQQKRRRWIIGSAVGAIALAIAGIAFFFQQQHQILSQVGVQQDRITLVRDNGESLTSFTRQSKPELFYRVTLKDAPLGQKLSISCNWIAPNQQIVHQNRYQTKEVTTPIWNTFCHHQLGSTSPVGNWKVQILLKNHPLGEETFDVR
jgi:hypothetical protein